MWGRHTWGKNLLNVTSEPLHCLSVSDVSFCFVANSQRSIISGMDARKNGFGFVIPMPHPFYSQLGNVVCFDQQGVLRSMGNIFEDDYFMNLVRHSTGTINQTPSEDGHESLTVAFTTGGMEVKSLGLDECSKYFPLVQA